MNEWTERNFLKKKKKKYYLGVHSSPPRTLAYYFSYNKPPCQKILLKMFSMACLLSMIPTFLGVMT